MNTLTIAFIGLSPDGRGQDKVLYLVVGALLWGFLSVLFHEVAESVQWERWEGTIEYSFMAPMRRLSYLGGVCLYACLLYTSLRVFILSMVPAVGRHGGLAQKSTRTRYRCLTGKCTQNDSRILDLTFGMFYTQNIDFRGKSSNKRY